MKLIRKRDCDMINLIESTDVGGVKSNKYHYLCGNFVSPTTQFGNPRSAIPHPRNLAFEVFHSGSLHSGIPHWHSGTPHFLSDNLAKLA